MSPAEDADAPLAGLRVVELATLYSAPQIGAMLGDLGADVVKVEPPGGDPMRRMGVIRDGVSRNWSWVARGKRSIMLDLDTDDRATFRQLVSAADVLIENLTPGVRARWDCTFDALAAVNPRLVVVAVSCYGLTGPYADRPGAGTLAEAFGGLTNLTGEPDGPPLLASVPLGDTLTAFSGVIGALAACWGRDRGDGPGRLVDLSMYEPVLQVLGGTFAAYDPNDAPARSGSRVRGGAPRNVYRTGDGAYVAVSGTTDPQVARLLVLLDRDGPDERYRYGQAEHRVARADELDALVAQWIAARDRDTVVDAFLEARIPIAPVHDVGSVLADPHVRARGSLEPMLAARGPDLDSDRAVILRDWLG